MNQLIVFVTLAVFAVQLYAAPPPFITFQDGKLGVNFGGYHAAVGVGGSQGLFAEAGTPFGQQASAGLGGNGIRGGLYAGATAGSGIQAQAGLGGTSNGQTASGAGFASAQYGNRIAAAGLGGEASENGASGVKFAGTNTGPTKFVVKETLPVAPAIPAKPAIENEIEGFENVLPLNANVQSRSNVDIQKEVRPIDTIEKTKIYTRPAHNVYKSVSYTGADKRSDVDVSGSDHIGTHEGPGSHSTVNKEVHFQRSPTFFSDIFNIPIQALKSVSTLLGTAADSTKVSVQKTATVSHDSNRAAYVPEASSSVSTGHQVTVESQQQPSDFLGNIFAIPINTLGAVNKFLENNVPARKRVQITETGDHNPDAAAAFASNVRLGKHARRRASKRVIVVDTSKAVDEPQH